MNWLKKAASPKLIKIALAVMAICAVFMIAIGEYLATFVRAFFWVIISTIELKIEKAPHHISQPLSQSQAGK